MFLIRVESISRFVHYQDFRVMNNCLRKTGAVTIPFRKRVDALVENRFQKTTLTSAVKRVVFCCAEQAPQLRAEIEETEDRHVAIHRCVFGQVANPTSAFERLFGDVESAYCDLAVGW